GCVFLGFVFYCFSCALALRPGVVGSGLHHRVDSSTSCWTTRTRRKKRLRRVLCNHHDAGPQRQGVPETVNPAGDVVAGGDGLIQDQHRPKSEATAVMLEIWGRRLGERRLLGVSRTHCMQDRDEALHIAGRDIAGFLARYHR
ncbi:hypothetical protein, partial [Mesorhizobium sp. M1273]|uniref:hypothetical protein n=1 Tax=Mesorhizobium sp. M1273 TaxID=2957075 RepID=UPI003336CE34